MRGTLTKMKTTLNESSLAEYQLSLGDESIALNEYINRSLRITFKNEFECTACKKSIKKLFGQGFCYPCFMNAPENSPCIIRPELCEAHLNKGRDLEWEIKNHLQEHVVYLALSGGLKVGVTRKTQIPSRWIDQGAELAVPIAVTPNRYLAGAIEVELKNYFSDKTPWQKMLKGSTDTLWNLEDEREKAIAKISGHNALYTTNQPSPTSIKYPVNQYPQKIKSLKLDKETVIEGRILGIKGQYILLDNDRVINIRSHSGYKVEFSILE